MGTPKSSILDGFFLCLSIHFGDPQKNYGNPVSLARIVGDPTEKPCKLELFDLLYTKYTRSVQYISDWYTVYYIYIL